VSEPSPAVHRRLDLLRHRRVAMAADRAAFESRRRHGLTARHEAKLAHLATRDATDPDEPPTEDVAESDQQEVQPATDLNDDAA
jgi:hypothetical protein